MKKLCITLCVLVVTLFAADRLGGRFMQWAYQHTMVSNVVRMRRLAAGVEADVWLFGPSRCVHHYDSSILADTLQMRVYNCGFSAFRAFQDYMLLGMMLQHHTPKVVCLELMPWDYYDTGDGLFGPNHMLAPLVGQSEAIDEIFKLDGSYRKYQWSHLYRYNGQAVSILSRMVFSYGTEIDNGFVALPKPRAFPAKLEPQETPAGLVPVKVRYLEKFIHLCEERHIRLVFCVSPCHTLVDAQLYAPLKEIAAAYGIPFLDYHTVGVFHNRPELFHDNTHLWGEGAKAFSRIFAGDLKRTICARPRGHKRAQQPICARFRNPGQRRMCPWRTKRESAALSSLETAHTPPQLSKADCQRATPIPK